MHLDLNCLLGMLLAATWLVTSTGATEPLALESRRELFVDDYLLDRLEGKATLRLHAPTPREIVLVFDQPWEGNSSGAYTTVFVDEGRYRMYYPACEQTLLGEPPAHEFSIGYAESSDGIHWVRPKLGLFDFDGSTENNIVWRGFGAEGFTPFRDPNPNCTPDAKYKAIGAGTHDQKTLALVAFKSEDGLHWSRMQEEPLALQGAFDSQNQAFWDPVRREYRLYARDFRDGRRDIITATSPDFLHWSPHTWIECPGAPPEHLYTNQVQPYYRAPHLLLGFPTRYIERGWNDSMRALPDLEHRQKRSAKSDREGMALTDGLFMSSRDGQTFHRWDEAFLRPGLRGTDNWAYGDNYQCLGLVETKSANADAPNDLSFYATEGYWLGKANKLRRYTLRQDGFASLHAPLPGGSVTTRPLILAGNRLVLNFSTSAAGTIRVAILDADGQPREGFALSDCSELFGDDLERTVTWKHGSDLSALAGQVVRLQITLGDADLYAMQFPSTAN